MFGARGYFECEQTAQTRTFELTLPRLKTSVNLTNVAKRHLLYDLAALQKFHRGGEVALVCKYTGVA